MNDHNHSDLDKQLKKIEGDVNWSDVRQRKVRQELISKIEQRDNRKGAKIKHGIKKKLAPAIAILMIIGISTALIFNGNILDQQSSIADDAASNSANERNSFNIQDLPYEISKEAEQNINEITNSGFDIRLPLTSISDDMHIINSHKRTNGENEEVHTLFSLQTEKQFRLSQETINSNNGENINYRLNQIKAEATENIYLENGMLAYIIDGKGGKTLYILTANYGFVLHSHNLSTEQIVSLANSIELSDLDE